MLGGFVCPWCRNYNANDATVCGRCHQRLPPKGLAGLIAELLGVELWATKLLVGLNLLVFAGQMAMTLAQKGDFLTAMPESVLLRFGGIAGGLELTEPWRLLSACFVHSGVLHIVFNLMALVQLGRVGEQAVAGPRFLVTYVVSGVVGFAVSGAWSLLVEHRAQATIGASGAIFGVAGMIAALMAKRGDARWKDMVFQMVAFSFLMGMGMHINQAAHLGGLAAGGLFGFLLARESRPWRISILVNAAAALSVVAIVVSLILPQRSPLWRQLQEREQSRQQLRDYVEKPIPQAPRGIWQPIE